MTQEEYWADYEVTRNEVSLAIQSFYAHLALNTYPAEDHAVLIGMNKAPLFWNITRYSLLTTFFITLGRVFDEDGDAHSIHKLLKATSAHPEYFSRAALAQRKRQSSRGVEPAWLADFLKDVWEPDAAALRELRRALVPSIKKYKAFYKPIRHTVFAHKGLKDTASVDALLSRAIILDVEAVLYALHDLLEAIHHLYYNGCKPVLGVRKYDYKEHNTKIAQSALASVKQDELDADL